MHRLALALTLVVACREAPHPTGADASPPAAPTLSIDQVQTALGPKVLAADDKLAALPEDRRTTLIPLSDAAKLAIARLETAPDASSAIADAEAAVARYTSALP